MTHCSILCILNHLLGFPKLSLSQYGSDGIGWCVDAAPGVGVAGRGHARRGRWGMNEARPGRCLFALPGAMLVCGFVLAFPGRAHTLPWALAQAYVNNPVMNAQRAAMRATDEGVGIALSGYRPTIRGTIVDGWNDQFQATKIPQ